MEVIFKGLELEDLNSTIDLCNLCFEENTDYDYARNVFIETMNDNNCIYINGIYNNEVVAHTRLTIIKTMYKPMATYALINHLCVKPEFRRHHLASHLLDMVFKVAKDRGCVEVVLWSKNFRVPAHTCYKKYGFQLLDAGFFSKKVDL